MKKKELQYQYAESLIAIEPASISRIFSAIQDDHVQNEEFKEIAFEELLAKFSPGDILVLNDTKVLPRRIFSADIEILFLETDDSINWRVLFPAKKLKLGTKIILPGNIEIELIEKGLPQKVKCSQALTDDYFEQYGDVPIPPYIQKARNERKSKPQDKNWYQTHWATKNGSFAAPTASLHFKPHHFDRLREKNVSIVKVTLHVGMGTFLPVHTEDLNDHQMHREDIFIDHDIWENIQDIKKKGGKVWALGTTVTRALESVPLGYIGSTNLLILPGFQFQVVDFLLTNFHQPESTLLALVFAFAGIEKVKAGYAMAIEKKFRLFSYGDLSIWKRA